MHLVAYLLKTYGYITLILILFLDSSGVPWPTEFTLVLAGMAAKAGRMNLPLVYVCALLGATGGSSLSFILGRRIGTGLVKRIGAFFRLTPDQLHKVDEWFLKHGEKAVFLGRFVPFVRSLCGYPAGASPMDFRKYLIFSIAGYAAYVAFALSLGYFGLHLARFLTDVEAIIWAGSLAVIGFAWYKWGRKWQQKWWGKG